jgi:hypothetical protein
MVSFWYNMNDTRNLPVLEFMLEVTLISKICFITGEQIIVHYLKVLCRNCRYCAPDETAAAWRSNRQYYRRVYGYIKSSDVVSDPAQFIQLCVT